MGITLDWLYLAPGILFALMWWTWPAAANRLGLVALNFRGDRVVQGYGVALWLPLSVLYALMVHACCARLVTACLVVVLGMGALGTLDDWLGDQSARGLRGHLRALRQGRVTTGLLKLVGGVLVAAVAGASLTREPLVAALYTLLIALCANGLNLMDLRPGRAVTLFLVIGLSLILAVVWRHSPLAYILLPAWIAAAAWRGRDADGRAMMGDSGSNPLGALLGVGIAASGGVALAGMATVLLLVIHIAAERVSISAVIERTAWLRRLDKLTGVR